ncbi:MAG: hypothetical protein K1X78_14845 [Verrucomicrobiaceae bacterium]|nr:hypothetical protein [Verrucomicrobiaceae bacterium]
MDPLAPNDPLWKLLGKARPVEPRPNFTRNVVRAARQTPQARGWWAVLACWFQDSPVALPRFVVGTAAGFAIAALIATQFRSGAPSSGTMLSSQQSAPVAAPVSVAEPPLLAIESQLETIDEIGALLALEDTSSLTDSEISFLLY